MPFEGDGEEEGARFEAEDERHPLLKATRGLLKDLHTLFREADPRLAPSLHALFQGAGDVMGGLAQALSGARRTTSTTTGCASRS